MNELTSEARELLDRYLNRARLSLRGTSVEADEVERDVRAHIAEALAGCEGPVTAADLSEVLDRLGSPTQWVPDEEVPLWRRTVANLTAGPEDWRLAYLCFGLTIIGLITIPVGGIVLVAGAVFLSRAAIALAQERDEPLGARRWLIYPPLVLLSFFLIAIPVIGPVAGIAGVTIEMWDHQTIDFAILGVDDSMADLIALIVAASGIWWVVLAGISALAARPIRWALVPVANGFRPVHAAWLAVTGAVLSVASGVALMFL